MEECLYPVGPNVHTTSTTLLRQTLHCLPSVRWRWHSINVALTQMSPPTLRPPRDAICLIARLFCQIGNKPPSAPHKEGGKEEKESSSPFFLPFPSGESRLEEGHHLHHHHPIGNIISRLRRRNDYLLCYTRMRESEEWVGMGRDLLTVSSQSL